MKHGNSKSSISSRAARSSAGTEVVLLGLRDYAHRVGLGEHYVAPRLGQHELVRVIHVESEPLLRRMLELFTDAFVRAVCPL